MTSAEGRLHALPVVRDWPQMRGLIGTLRGGTCAHWEYADYAFVASGGSGDNRTVGSAAIYCLLLSVGLVDDLLDGDAPGPVAGWEAGQIANVALAFQAAAVEVIEAAPVPRERRAACHAHIARAMLLTARGQDSDRGEVMSEADYWRIVDAKTTPLLCASLALGAELAEAAPESVAAVMGLGIGLGRMLQVYDDLHDALLVDSLVDWQRPRHNLALHYALEAPHAERERFAHLLAELDRPETLAQARGVVRRSGALSYCVYHLVELDAALRRQLAAFDLPRPDVLVQLVDHHVAPVEALLAEVGFEWPRDRRA